MGIQHMENGKIMDTVQQFEKVVEFMKVGSQNVFSEFNFPSWKTGAFRLRLIDEELNGKNELIDSLQNDKPVGVLDGICDVLYVVYGAYATFGLIPLRWTIPTINKNTNPVPPMHRSWFISRALNGAYDRLVRGLEIGDQPTISSSLRDVVDNIIELSIECGFDVAGAFDEVHASNMSKFCDSYESANRSIEKRLATGNSDYYDASIAVVEVGDVKYYVIKRHADGKILKGENFFEPDLEKYIP